MTKQRITRGQIEELRVQLRKLPPVNISAAPGTAKKNRQVIAEAIAQLKASNYSLEQIAEILKGNRMDLTPKPLRDYLNGL